MGKGPRLNSHLLPGVPATTDGLPMSRIAHEKGPGEAAQPVEIVKVFSFGIKRGIN